MITKSRSPGAIRSRSPQDEAAIVAPPEIGRRFFQPRTLLGFLIAAVVLYFFYKRGARLDFREVWARMRGANAVLLLLTSSSTTHSFIFRTLRWRTLLSNVGYSRERGCRCPRPSDSAKSSTSPGSPTASLSHAWAMPIAATC
jgi:hypothetical protein